MKRQLLILLVFLLLPVACSAQAAVAPDDVPQAATSAATETAVSEPTPPKSDDLPPDAVIRFRRSGGIAGMQEEWLVYRDGRIATPDGSQERIPADEVSQALTRITELGFFEFKQDYVGESNCCDRFFYEITVAVDGRTHTVITLDDSPYAPADLEKSLDLVNGLLNRDDS